MVWAVIPAPESAPPTARGNPGAHSRAGLAKSASPESNRVYLTDGNQYLNRPGPRLAESLEILAEIIHPGLFRFHHRGTAWQEF
jgi:ABC-type hemin transport system substrate-binding protein